MVRETKEHLVTKKINTVLLNFLHKFHFIKNMHITFITEHNFYSLISEGRQCMDLEYTNKS